MADEELKLVVSVAGIDQANAQIEKLKGSLQGLGGGTSSGFERVQKQSEGLTKQLGELFKTVERGGENSFLALARGIGIFNVSAGVAATTIVAVTLALDKWAEAQARLGATARASGMDAATLRSNASALAAYGISLADVAQMGREAGEALNDLGQINSKIRRDFMQSAQGQAPFWMAFFDKERNVSATKYINDLTDQLEKYGDMLRKTGVNEERITAYQKAAAQQAGGASAMNLVGTGRRLHDPSPTESAASAANLRAAHEFLREVNEIEDSVGRIANDIMGWAASLWVITVPLKIIGAVFSGIAHVADVLSSGKGSSIQSVLTPTLGGIHVPKMAQGGIVTSPTLAMIGEAGPEAVVPLGAGGGGAGGTQDQLKELNANLRELNSNLEGIIGFGGTRGKGGGRGGSASLGGGAGHGGAGGGASLGDGGGAGLGGNGFVGGGGTSGGGGASGGWGDGGVTPSATPHAGGPGGNISGGGEVNDAIRATAGKAGMDEAHWKAIASIESSLTPGSNANKSTQYKGLFQIGSRGADSEWARKGHGNIYNARDNADAAAALAAENNAAFKKHFGRDPTPTETYMMHQQGLGFYTKGAMTNIGGNPYPGMHGPQTHESFEAGWGRELERRAAGYASGGGTSSSQTSDAGASQHTAPNTGSGAAGIPGGVLAAAKQVALQTGGDAGAVQRFMASQGIHRYGNWCGEFTAAVVKSAGLQPPAGYAVASNWRKFGTPDAAPHPGDIAIRKGTPTGSTGSHVGIVASVGQGGAFTLEGGNQGRLMIPQQTGRYDFRTPPGGAGGGGGFDLPGGGMQSQAHEQPSAVPTAHGGGGGMGGGFGGILGRMGGGFGGMLGGILGGIFGGGGAGLGGGGGASMGGGGECCCGGGSGGGGGGGGGGGSGSNSTASQADEQPPAAPKVESGGGGKGGAGGNGVMMSGDEWTKAAEARDKNSGVMMSGDEWTAAAQRQALDGSGRGTTAHGHVTLNVNVPQGTQVAHARSGLFKNVTINRNTQMAPASNGPVAPHPELVGNM